MSAWTDLGLPLPNARAYGYTRDAALLRTPFKAIYVDQSQRNTNWRKTFDISWDLTLDQLPLAEQYLLEHGYSWFDLELVSNETPINEIISTHQIRLISNYKIQPIAGLYFRLTAQIESRINPQSCELITCDTITNFENPICDFIPETSIFVSTNLYPTEVIESLKSTGFLITASVFKGFVESAAIDGALTAGNVAVTLAVQTIDVGYDEAAINGVLTSGIVVNALAVKTVDVGYDDAVVNGVLVSGNLETTLAVYNHPGDNEPITSVGVLVSAILQ